MALNISSPVTGLAQTGFTSPTYTVVADQAVSLNSKQHLVSALGGTQAGVTVHSISSPFTLSVARPSVFKTPGVVNPVTGALGPVGKNTTKVITRKGVTPLAGQAPQLMLITTDISVPAGADVADPANIRAAIALHVGALMQYAASLGDSVIQGSV